MSRKTLRLACAVVALSCPAFAQQSPPQPGNAPAPSAKADVESAIPLTPGMIRDLGRRVGDNSRAEEEVNTEIASPISRRVNVSFAPGQSTPIVRIVKGYPTALSFFDRTGQPWPIEWDTNSNPAGTGEQRQLQPGSGGRRRSCRRQRRFLCLHAHGGLERPAGGRGVFAAARRAPGHAQGRAEADLVHAGRGRAEPTTPISRCRWRSEVRTPRVRRPARSLPTPLRPS